MYNINNNKMRKSIFLRVSHYLSVSQKQWKHTLKRVTKVTVIKK